MPDQRTPTALIIGASRGVGAATAIQLAARGFRIAVNYRDPAKNRLAIQVVTAAQEAGSHAFPVRADITTAAERAVLFSVVKEVFDNKIDLLVINARGGLDHDYAARINTAAQALPLIPRGSTIIFVISNQVHYNGDMGSGYRPIANSKKAGENALRALMPNLTERGIRLLVVTGDIARDSTTAMLLNRNNDGLLTKQKAAIGELPTTEQFATAIADAALDPSLGSGHTIQVGPMPS